MKRIALITVLLVFAGLKGSAALDTIQVYSNSMFKNVKCVVITPANYKAATERYPVVYLLHGYSGNYADWVKKVPAMQQLADNYNLMIVCPDGDFSSWYFDSSVDLTRRFETNVAVEIPKFIDANYRTINNRNARAITGLSMGGHGGLFLGLRHADNFGACGSMSGGLDISHMRQFGIDKVLGDTIVNEKYYNDWAVVNLIERYPKDSVAMLIDCGVGDFFLEANRKTHEKLLRLKIPHDYIERPGSHNWDYWRNAINYQMLFFRIYFNKAKNL